MRKRGTYQTLGAVGYVRTTSTGGVGLRARLVIGAFRRRLQRTALRRAASRWYSRNRHLSIGESTHIDGFLGRYPHPFQGSEVGDWGHDQVSVVLKAVPIPAQTLHG